VFKLFQNVIMQNKKMWTLKDVLERPHLFPLLLYIIWNIKWLQNKKKGLQIVLF
jgi:hypothetical protein